MTSTNAPPGVPDRPRFGIFILPVMNAAMADDAQQALGDTVSDVVAAESAGLQTAWFAEHHGHRYGGACPNALTMAAHLAGRTSRIILGAAACILPLHHPVRLAEEALMVDHLSGGRLELGVGRGFLAVDFATLGVHMDERHHLFEQNLRVVSQLEQDSLAGHKLFPPAFHDSGIPLWGAAASSVESIAFFASAGMGIMLNPYTRTPQEVTQSISLYRRLLAEAHPLQHPRILIHEHLYVAATEEEAREAPRPYLMSYLEALREASLASGSGYVTQHTAGPERYEDLYPARVAFDTPHHLRVRIANWLAAGVTDFAFSLRFGGMPANQFQQSLQRFTNEVMPYFIGST